MSRSSILEKVRPTRPRASRPTPKEQDLWRSFVTLAKELQGEKPKMTPIVQAELDRLVAKGNPLAIDFKRRLEALAYKPRAASELPLPPPPGRRISRLKWGHPDSATTTSDEVTDHPSDGRGKRPQ